MWMWSKVELMELQHIELFFNSAWALVVEKNYEVLSAPVARLMYVTVLPRATCIC